MPRGWWPATYTEIGLIKFQHCWGGERSRLLQSLSTCVFAGKLNNVQTELGVAQTRQMDSSCGPHICNPGPMCMLYIHGASKHIQMHTRASELIAVSSQHSLALLLSSLFMPKTPTLPTAKCLRNLSLPGCQRYFYLASGCCWNYTLPFKGIFEEFDNVYDNWKIPF